MNKNFKKILPHASPGNGHRHYRVQQGVLGEGPQQVPLVRGQATSSARNDKWTNWRRIGPPDGLPRTSIS